MVNYSNKNKDVAKEPTTVYGQLVPIMYPGAKLARDARKSSEPKEKE